MMKRGMLILCLLLYGCAMTAQPYADSMATYRRQYISELLADARSPIKPSQTGGLHFFKVDAAFRVYGTFTATPGSTPFMIETHSGKKKPYREYGTVDFSIHDTALTLHLYQSIDLVQGAGSNTHLFIPFYDLTNYESTYGGGRYLDVETTDIQNNRLTLDFNKCYNPYCAYAGGYSCPIPPHENYLHIEIKAGELVFDQ